MEIQSGITAGVWCGPWASEHCYKKGVPDLRDCYANGGDPSTCVPASNDAFNECMECIGCGLD